MGLVALVVASASADRKRPEPAPPAAPPAPPPPPEEPAPEPSGPPAPWAVGVSAERQDRAQALLVEGNELFLASKYREALAKYEEAIAAWDHPAIRFNLVRSLINLDRPVEAFANLERALKYGADPLQEDVYAEAITYRKLLLGQIAELEIRCESAGTRVTLDGQPLLECPGQESRRLVPGSHQVVAKATGFLTFIEEIVLLPGKQNSVSVKMIAVSDAAVMVRRWKAWKPWVVAGAGVAVAGIGGLLQWKAKADFDTYGEEIARSCGDAGCLPEAIPGPVQDLESRAGLENGFAIGAFVTGGALVVTGVVMVILNTPRSVVPEHLNAPGKTAIVPLVSPHDAGIGVVMRF